MAEAVIVSAVRTAVGRAGRGVFATTRPDDLASFAVRGGVVAGGDDGMLSRYYSRCRVLVVAGWGRLAWLGEHTVLEADGLGCGGERVCGCDSRGSGCGAKAD